MPHAHLGLGALMQAYPTPETPNVPEYRFSLDGGGRDLLTEYFRANDTKLVLELGCFLCGSVLQWLESKSDLIVIGVDPWEGKWHEIIERYIPNPVFDSCFKGINDRHAFAASLKAHGPYLSSMANLQRYRDRFVPLVGKSPEKLYELKGRQISPDFIYFDNDKGLADLNVALELFPDATLGGDDWTWGKDQGLPVQKAVKQFCERHGFDYEARRATWIIRKD
ncbi:hypothetical protein [Tateyamaria sp. SN6-1]|uniref:hypothetical protein n=1 Tax=Tateyamaria sp. SN6-1 TaxID=3092148 RepID=UPI0039F5A75A